MKKNLTLICTTFLCIIINESFAQTNNPIKLDVIKDYPIKIDGGCSFYASDTSSFKNKQYIFIVSAKKTGFIYVDNKYVLLKEVSQQNMDANNYSDLFKGDGYEIELDITKNAKMNSNTFMCEGIMTLKKEGYTVINKVYGKIEGF
jgi:hypothetical protein